MEYSSLQVNILDMLPTPPLLSSLPLPFVLPPFPISFLRYLSIIKAPKMVPKLINKVKQTNGRNLTPIHQH